MPSITAIIPTVATDLPRLTLLRRSMESALHQMQPGDELLVAADITDGPLDAVRELCSALQPMANLWDSYEQKAIPTAVGPRVRYLPHAGEYHTFGHEQINHAMTIATGDYLTFNDDDDIWCPGAFDAIRDAVARQTQTAPMLFRFLSYHGPVFWLAPGLVGKGLIGGHCAVVPNHPGFLGHWGAPEGYDGPRPYYEGDWTFVETTLALWANVGVDPVFVDRLIARARP